MKEKMNKVWSWIKENPWTVLSEVTLLSLTIGEGVLLLTENERIRELETENKKLKGENLDLTGQIRAEEKENRRLSRENGNLNYQLGKVVASKTK